MNEKTFWKVTAFLSSLNALLCCLYLVGCKSCAPEKEPERPYFEYSLDHRKAEHILECLRPEVKEFFEMIKGDELIEYENQRKI